jgi:membrane-associated protease RseP (regulator of RpoE activity)
LLSSRAAKAAGLIDREPPSGGGLAALFSTSLAPKRAETFALGDAVQRDMAVMVMDHPAIDQLSAIAGELDGIVGLTFFSRYRTAIDYQAGTLTFTPSDYDRPGLMESGAADALRLMGLGGAGAARNVIGRSIVLGLTLDESAPKDETVVGSIAPQGSAAEAGLLPGDRITRIDGRWIETREDFARALSAIPPNVAVGVVVRREDAEIRLTLVTRSGM